MIEIDISKASRNDHFDQSEDQNTMYSPFSLLSKNLTLEKDSFIFGSLYECKFCKYVVVMLHFTLFRMNGQTQRSKPQDHEFQNLQPILSKAN